MGDDFCGDKRAAHGPTWHVGAYIQEGRARSVRDSMGVGRRKGRTHRVVVTSVQCGLWDFNLIKQFVTEYGTRQ